MEDLLGDLHQQKDDRDWAILSGDKPRFSESRLKSRNKLRAAEADLTSAKSNALSYARESAFGEELIGKDFLNPFNPIQQRTVGYTSGHVRSIHEADTFGPKHSMHVELKRSEGLVPQSPNTDRNRLLITNEERKQFVKSKIAKNVISKNIRSANLTYTKERSALSTLDARSKGNNWFNTYRQEIKSRKDERERAHQTRMNATLNMKEIEEEYKRMDDFESKLKASSKFR